MRLRFKPFDGRAQNFIDVTDEETGKVVGYIQSFGVGTYCSGGINVSLFDEKYEGHFNRYEEVVGFVLGVQAVLNHMTRLPEVKEQAAA